MPSPKIGSFPGFFERSIRPEPPAALARIRIDLQLRVVAAEGRRTDDSPLMERFRKQGKSPCFEHFVLMGTIVNGQSHAILPSAFDGFSSSVAFCLCRPVQKKPVMSRSYPQSAAFAALALYGPSSEVQASERIRNATKCTHSSGTGHPGLSLKPGASAN